MSELISIAAVAENGVIGADGDMVWHVPEDFKHFKRTTMGHPMIMGRTTFDGMGALPGRRSIVVTRNTNYSPDVTDADDVTVVHSLQEALDLVQSEDAFVVGGAQIYAAAMPYVTKLIISEMPLKPVGDAHFPTIDADVWRETQRDPREGFTVVTYERRHSSRDD